MPTNPTLERSYRKTFEKAVNDEKDLYDMRPEETATGGLLKRVCCLKAAATAPVYVGLLLLGVIVIVCA